jgi:hypothetical protein
MVAELPAALRAALAGAVGDGNVLTDRTDGF